MAGKGGRRGEKSRQTGRRERMRHRLMIKEHERGRELW